MMFDRNAMREQLLNRTKASYDRKENEGGGKYFKQDIQVQFFKARPTKGKPHIIDILPYVAGNNQPTVVEKPTKEGEWAYVLDIFVHKNVGPGKTTVVCPAKNYGKRCPICEEIDDLTRDGMEYREIPFTIRRQCCYNVLVMDDATTESKGVQVWDVPYSYSEGAIVAIAQSRKGSMIPFSDPSKEYGRSVIFDVGDDTYKKITGHRFEQRDYDIPDEIVAQAHCLDELIIVHTYDELADILWGEGGKKPAQEETSAGRSLRNRGNLPSDERPEEAESGRSSLRNQSSTAGNDENRCPIGAKFGEDNDKYADCTTDCNCFQACAEAKDLQEFKQAKTGVKEPVKEEPTKEEPVKEEPQPTSGRRLLRRPGK